MDETRDASGQPAAEIHGAISADAVCGCPGRGSGDPSVAGEGAEPRECFIKGAGLCASPAELRRRFGPDGSHFPKPGVPVQAEIQSHKAPELIGQSRWKIQKIRWNQAIPADFCIKGDR